MLSLKCYQILPMLLLYIYSILAYKYVRTQDYVCADKFILNLRKQFKGNPTITLEDDEDSAAIITQTWNSTANTKINYNCHFRVVAKERSHRGLYNIITKLKFRRNHETKECYDFIQFSNGLRYASEKICEDVSPDTRSNRLIFDKRHKEVTVHIFIDKRRPIIEPLELSMVITSHSECRHPNDLLCDAGDPQSCISRHFVRDNITNCLFPCRDETHSSCDEVTTEVMDTTNVAISAITSLIFTMTGVGFCIWVCWKYWNCITIQQQQAHEDSRGSRTRDSLSVDLPQSPYEGVITTMGDPHHPLPSAPKDLPPSYESLFPDR